MSWLPAQEQDDNDQCPSVGVISWYIWRSIEEINEKKS